MIVLGIDTATAATAVGLLDGARPLGPGGGERRHDPAPGERPGHSAVLMSLAAGQLSAAGLTFADVQRVAVGVGPGGFTGLRIGVATARALAQAAGAQLRGVSSLRALALGAHASAGRRVLAVIDARRGEVFVAGFEAGEELLAARALAPPALAAAAGAGSLAVGDGAVRFRSDLEGAGCEVPPDESPQHRISAIAVCRLALESTPGTAPQLVLPDYLRPPDAVRTRR